MKVRHMVVEVREALKALKVGENCERYLEQQDDAVLPEKLGAAKARAVTLLLGALEIGYDIKMEDGKMTITTKEKVILP